MTARKQPRLKLLAGTSRRDRESPDRPALPPVYDVPRAPHWLSKDLVATREWNRLAAVLVANKLLTVGNLGALGQLCALHGHLTRAWSDGVTPSGSMMAAYRALCVELGLFAMRLPPPVTDKPNRFANFTRGRDVP